MTRVIAADKSTEKTLVGDVATKNLTTVQVDESVRKCAEILKEKRFRHLPVMDGGKAVGILSARDFFEFVVDGLERYVDQMRYQEDLADGLDPYDHFGGGYGK